MDNICSKFENIITLVDMTLYPLHSVSEYKEGQIQHTYPRL